MEKKPPKPPAFKHHAAAMAVLALAASASTQAPCSPGFTGFYDLKVGDIFQYRSTQGSPAEGALPSESMVQKYTVVSRRQAGDTLHFVRAGVRQMTAWSDGVLISKTSHRFLDTMKVEAADHSFLEACSDSLVHLPARELPGDPLRLWTHVKASTGNTDIFGLARPGQRLKKFGGAGNLFKESVSGLVPVTDAGITYVYAEGFGLVHTTVGRFGRTRSYTLEGHAHGSDTLGRLDADAAILDSLLTGTLASARPGRRTSARPGLRLSATPTVPWKGGRTFRLDGRLAPSK